MFASRDRRPWLSGLTVTVPLGLLAIITGLSAGSCLFDTKTNLCEANGILIRCKPGQLCAPKGASVECVDPNSCGDGKLNLGEKCDDGNLTEGDGCDSNCTRSECGNNISAISEMQHEECDDGNFVDGDGCDSNCRATRCGNGIPTMGEACDDGNVGNLDACVENCVKASCGDSYQQIGVEECDDNNNITEVCPYGVLSCMVCTEDCRWVPGTISSCGDGAVQSPHEVCDDGNNLPCGSCTVSCGGLSFKAAVGMIEAIAAVNHSDDGLNGMPEDTFTISDGINNAVTFEFDKDMKIQPGNFQIQIADGNSASTVRNLIDLAILNSGLLIGGFRDPNEPNLELVHKLNLGIGNKLITENVVNADFKVSGMAGGSGSDCSTGDGCEDDLDCASKKCIGNMPASPGVCE